MDGRLPAMALKCAACGQCRPVCPSFGASGGWEHESPRGRVLLSGDLLAGKVAWTPGAVETLSRCLLCNSCVAECPSGVPVDDIILEARAKRARDLGLPAGKRALGRVLARPGLLALLARTGAVLAGVAGGGGNRIRWPPLRRAGTGGRLVPTPARQALSAQAAPRGTPTFVFYRGCLIEHVTTEAGLALVGLARLAGEEPAFLPGEVCCGLPVLAWGDIAGFRRLAARNIKLFGVTDLPVVTACATCTATLRKYYVKYPPPGLEAEARELAGRVQDAVEFLAARELPAGRGRLGRYTYHQPCHHHKGIERKVDGSALLSRLGGVDYVPPSDPAACCGFGGSFSVDHYAESRALAQSRLENLLATGASGVATACPGCLVHLRDAIAQGGHDFEAVHVLELMWRALRSG